MTTIVNSIGDLAVRLRKAGVGAETSRDLLGFDCSRSPGSKRTKQIPQEAFKEMPSAELRDAIEKELQRLHGIASRVKAEEADEPMVGQTNTTEHELALQFAARSAHCLRWSGGLGWMHFDGARWKRDEMKVHLTMARDVCAKATANSASDAKRLQSARTVAGVIALAQLDERLQVPPELWDSEPLLLNTPGGIVDLRTGAIRPRSYADLVTHCTAVTPAQSEDCPRFQQFIDEVFGHDAAMRRFVQRSIGYCLTGDRREQKLWFAYGEGGNGKSVLMDLLLMMWGSYAVKLPATLLMTSRTASHPTGLAMLQGRRLAISSELEEGQHLSEALVKELTGDQFLSARFLYRDFFQFPQQQKHVIVGNVRPRLHGGDRAMARRLLLVPFDMKFDGDRADKTLPDTLRREAPGIMRWAINGCVQWLADGLAVPQAVSVASTDYLHQNDDLALWRSERCRPIHEARANELYRDFAQWKRDRGEVAPGQGTWGERMSRVEGVEKMRRSSGVVYLGISLVPAEPGSARYGDHRG